MGGIGQCRVFQLISCSDSKSLKCARACICMHVCNEPLSCSACMVEVVNDAMNKVTGFFFEESRHGVNMDDVVIVDTSMTRIDIRLLFPSRKVLSANARVCFVVTYPHQTIGGEPAFHHCKETICQSPHV